jgi:hypothetical protein
MINLRLDRYALGICASAILVGCGGTPGGQTAFSRAQTVAQPQNHWCSPFGPCFTMRVRPPHPTIRVNQQQTLEAWIWGPSNGKYQPDATWKSSGGSLQVIDGGKDAIFSASSPGQYRVVARVGALHGRAIVTVTSP